MLESRDRTQATNNCMSAVTLDEVHEQAIELSHFSLPHIFHHDADHLQPFGQGEEWMLGGIGCDGNDYLIKHSETARDDVGVSMSNRIKGSWIDANFHEAVDCPVDNPYK